MPWLVGDYVLNRSNGLQYMSRLMKQEGRLDARDRYRGCLLGLAAGDALGTRLEFQQPGTFIPIDDLLGEGPFHLEAGQWTDDTSMALCLAEVGGHTNAGLRSTTRKMKERVLQTHFLREGSHFRQW